MSNILPLICENCNYEWQDTLDLPMVINAFVSRLKGTLCPKCGSKKVGIKTIK